MNTLPEYFVIEKDENNPLWGKYIDWLNKKYSTNWSGNLYKFYGYDGRKTISGTNGEQYISHFENNPTLITLEQWNECVNGFVLPEKWCVVRDPNSYQSVNKFFTEAYKGKKKFTANGVYFQYAYTDYLHYPAIKDKTLFHGVQSGYTLITYEQFQKYVLKSDSMIDYKIPGTPIPCINGVNMQVCSSHTPRFGSYPNGYTFLSTKDYISYGSQIVNEETLIQVETAEYGAGIYWLVRESDLLSLTPNTMSDTKQESSKEFVGYKLLKPEYNDAALKIVGIPRWTFSYLFGHKSLAKESLEKAGVLDIWFEPIYESEEKTIDMGGFNLTVKAGKVYHDNEDITQYVKELVSFYNVENTFAGYVARVEDITFSKTGCQQNSKLSDWVKVYNELNKQANV